MNLRRIYLRVHASNTIAMRCYKKVGFKKEGRLERRTGGDTREIIYLMGLSKQEFLANGEGEPQAV
jgi:RimJ/RimL family protein N-acetyltransferase